MRSFAVALIALPATAGAQTLRATFDAFAEGSPALSITDGAITVSNLDQAIPPPTIGNFIIERADATLAGQPGFTPNNCLGFGGYSPGPSAAFSRCKSFEIRWTGGAASSGQLEVFHFASSAGNTCTLQGWYQGAVVDSAQFTFPGGFVVSHNQLRVSNGPFDMLRLLGGGPTDSGVFFGLADTIEVVVMPPSSGSDFCYGDGSGTTCPCGNASPPGDDVGCLNSLGLGGKLRATGAASIAADTIVLAGSQMPNASALYFQGTTDLNGGAGAVFGDGLRCAGGSLVRLGTKLNSAGASQFPAAGDGSVSQLGLVTSPGSRTYQVWYRNAASFCAAETFNLTNGIELNWGA
jgi:hypothetical protein